MKKILIFKSPEFKPFMERRLEIQRLFYLALFCAYAIEFIVIHPIDTPSLSLILTIIASPLFVFPFYLRSCSLFFVRNWLYIAYLIVSSSLFIYTMSLFSYHFYEQRFGTYEIAHILLAAVAGFCSALAVSFPFKLIQMILFDTDLYITSDALLKIEYEAFPEKKKVDIEKKKEKFKFDTLNETQLQVELKNAVKEDRFEDAEAIRKILEKKFR